MSRVKRVLLQSSATGCSILTSSVDERAGRQRIAGAYQLGKRRAEVFEVPAEEVQGGPPARRAGREGRGLASGPTRRNEAAIAALPGLHQPHVWSTGSRRASELGVRQLRELIDSAPQAYLTTINTDGSAGGLVQSSPSTSHDGAGLQSTRSP